jgi:3-hydroxy-9,10-secoandrosta-1,3,5(10)-triene-9,17-dione monooxygenase
MIGMVYGSIDELSQSLRGTSGRGRTADSTAIHLRLAEASAEADVARLLHLGSVRASVERAGRGETFSEMDRARNQRDKAFATRLCVQAVNRLFDASGGHALFESASLQRHHRDVHAASHQLRLQWDTFGAEYGRLALGLEPA